MRPPVLLRTIHNNVNRTTGLLRLRIHYLKLYLERVSRDTLLTAMYLWRYFQNNLSHVERRSIMGNKNAWRTGRRTSGQKIYPTREETLWLNIDRLIYSSRLSWDSSCLQLSVIEASNETRLQSIRRPLNSTLFTSSFVSPWFVYE